MPANLPAKFCVIALCGALTGCSVIHELTRERMSNSEKANLNLQMGVRYMELGMLDGAKEKLEQAASLDSGNSEIQNALAVFSERVKDYGEAGRRYEAALNHDPGNFNIKSNYGRLLCEQGQFDKGTQLLQEALATPMNNQVWLAQTNMGLCLERQNQSSQAEGYFRQALQGNGQYAPALLELQKISYQNQQYMSARAFLERYLAVSKHTPESLWLAFQTERALGNRNGADEYKDQLLTLFPASKEAQEVRTAISR